MAPVKFGLVLALSALMASLMPQSAPAAEAVKTEEPVLEVDLGDEPTPTPVPAAETPEATEATEEPTEAPTPTVVATEAPKSGNLGEVRFDKAPVSESEDGLMIIAPGAATAEDSLESFGIDSPFNWKSKGRRTLEPGKELSDEEALELAAPESSDLSERVRVETSEGDELPSDADYNKVERAGLVYAAGEYRVDGQISRTKDGQFFAKEGRVVALKMEAGRQVYPGSIYTAFREQGVLKRLSGDEQEMGMAVRNVGVLKVIRIEGEEVLARVEKQYETVREGDLVRLRDPDRLRYYNSVRQGANRTPLDLKGEIIGLPEPKMMARKGDTVFVDAGRAQGLAPGTKLIVYQTEEAPGLDRMRRVRVTGRVGQLVVLNVSRDSSVAKVVSSVTDIRPGDKVRLR